MNLDSFSVFFREQREQNKLTQKEVAKLLNVTNSSVSKWERGLSLPEISKIDEIAKIFGISTSEVINCQINKNNMDRDYEKDHSSTLRKTTYKRLIYVATVLIAGLIVLFIGIKFWVPKTSSEIIEATLAIDDSGNYKVMVEPYDLTYPNKEFYISSNELDPKYEIGPNEVYRVRFVSSSVMNSGDYIHNIQSIEKRERK